jgi:signal transduction histidine kinase
MYLAAILVVENSRPFNKAMCAVLAAQGYRVACAHDGQEALDLLRRRPVDLVVSDVAMPRLDGYGLLQAMRAEPRLRHLPVVFLTNHATPDERRRAKACGVEDYLVTLLDDDDLLLTVRNALHRRAVLEEAVQYQVGAVRNQILGLIQHEFRTPLTFVMGYAEFLQSALGAKGTERAELQRSVEAILEGGRRLHHLIESFLLLAGLSGSSLQTGDLYPLDPMALWRESANMLQLELKQANLCVHFEETPPLIAYGVLELVREALVRLLGNAIVYRRPTSRTIWLSAAAQPGFVGWMIRDEGIGIPAAKQGQIMQPFARVPHNPPGSHGAGLGLTLVQRVAQLHSGCVTVESQEGIGSTFGLWISDAEPDL